MLFDDYQKQAHRTATADDTDVYSLGLIGEAGSVAASIKKFKRDAPSREAGKKVIQEELGDALWYVAEIATRFGLIPFWLLETIKKMTVDVEVRARSTSDWADAIAAGFQIFDQLRRHEGGFVLCDLDKKNLAFTAK